MFEFFRTSWKQLGLDVEIVATDYNAFQDKMRVGAYQVFWCFSCIAPTAAVMLRPLLPSTLIG